MFRIVRESSTVSTFSSLPNLLCEQMVDVDPDELHRLSEMRPTPCEKREGELVFFPVLAAAISTCTQSAPTRSTAEASMATSLPRRPISLPRSAVRLVEIQHR